VPARPPAFTIPRTLIVAVIGGIATLALMLLGTPAHATPSYNELTKEINDKSQQFNHAVEQYDRIQSDLTASRKKAATLEKRIKPLQKKVNAAEAQVGQIASVAYRGGEASAWNAVLSSGSADSTLESLSTLNQLARGQEKQIAALNSDKAALDKRKQALDDTITEQKASAKQLKSKKNDLDKQISKLKTLREQAYGSVDQASNTDYGPPPAVSGRAGEAVDFAWDQLGKPYSYGAAGPGSYDCSGLTMASWQAAGISLPHNAAAQYSATTRISSGELAPGDLVFYYNNDHVGIYIGGGQIIHAPTYGEPVQKASVDSMPINGYGRVS
jgi:peptidoglycan DL-endopeptidase CwlO